MNELNNLLKNSNYPSTSVTVHVFVSLGCITPEKSGL